MIVPLLGLTFIFLIFLSFPFCWQTSLANFVPHLSHLHARFCKRVTDIGVRAIASSLEDLYTLDLSFCTKLSAHAIASLLELRGGSLSELRLQGCYSLTIGGAVDHRRPPGLDPPGAAGRAIVNALRSHGPSCCLSALDVRDCGGQPPRGTPYPTHDPFFIGMTDMGFRQRVAGYFDRPACWNNYIERRLVHQLRSETQHHHDVVQIP